MAYLVVFVLGMNAGVALVLVTWWISGSSSPREWLREWLEID